GLRVGGGRGGVRRVGGGGWERRGDSGGSGLVFLGEARGSLLVQELDDTDRLALVHDRHAEDLRRPESGLLVPGAVEGEGWGDARQLSLVVGSGYGHHPTGGRPDAGGARLRAREACLA